MSSVPPAITVAEKSDLPRLLEVWESSVRATHSLLSEDNIRAFGPLVKEELARTSPLYCLRDSAGQVYAFMGVVGTKMEMLFVAPQHRGAGAGRKLVEFAVQVLGIDTVDVNEQNEQAVGFYRRMGFRQIGRSAFDPTGNPFPILHLKLMLEEKIETGRLLLQLSLREELLAAFEGHPEVSPDWLVRVRAAAEPDPFLFGFAVIERASGSQVGTAGFTGPPGGEGVVEIAYGIEPAHQCRGYATEAAKALVAFAFCDQRVRLVRAHTKSENIASKRVLEKCGFRLVGEVVDPEDGWVERWEHEQVG